MKGSKANELRLDVMRLTRVGKTFVTQLWEWWSYQSIQTSKTESKILGTKINVTKYYFYNQSVSIIDWLVTSLVLLVLKKSKLSLCVDAMLFLMTEQNIIVGLLKFSLCELMMGIHLSNGVENKREYFDAVQLVYWTCVCFAKRLLHWLGSAESFDTARALSASHSCLKWMNLNGICLVSEVLLKAMHPEW